MATVDADSFFGVLSRKQKISRPATPVTPDWGAAERSVREMASLRPRVLAPGHGEPMEGPAVADVLAAFSEDFAAPGAGATSASLPGSTSEAWRGCRPRLRTPCPRSRRW